MLDPHTGSLDHIAAAHTTAATVRTTAENWTDRLLPALAADLHIAYFESACIYTYVYTYIHTVMYVCIYVHTYYVLTSSRYVLPT